VALPPEAQSKKVLGCAIALAITLVVRSVQRSGCFPAGRMHVTTSWSGFRPPDHWPKENPEIGFLKFLCFSVSLASHCSKKASNKLRPRQAASKRAKGDRPGRKIKSPAEAGQSTILEGIKMKMRASDSANPGCFEATHVFLIDKSPYAPGVAHRDRDAASAGCVACRVNPEEGERISQILTRMAETSAVSVRFLSGALSAKK
jgi:hypothetical protein